MDIQSACFASLGIVTFIVFGSPHSKTIYKQLSGVLKRCCGGEEEPKEGSNTPPQTWNHTVNWTCCQVERGVRGPEGAGASGGTPGTSSSSRH